jgi:type IV pilus assembly protein PilN
MMTPGRGPSVDPDRLSQLRRENPLAVYNPGWDARRLWIVKYIETMRNVRIEGNARDGEDVSELARRMALSSYFADVKLLPAKKAPSQEAGMDLVNFQLQARAKY